MRVIYLDFNEAMPKVGDPADEIALFAWTDRLAALVAPHPDVRVALHGAWPTTLLVNHVEHFLAALHGRLVGIVDEGPRQQSILSHIHKHPDVVDCIVVDSHLLEFQQPLSSHLVQCDASLGIRDPAVLRQVGTWVEEAGSRSRDKVACRERLLSGFVPPPPRAPQLRKEPESVVAVVTVLIEEFELVHLETPDGFTLSVGENTKGIDWRTLRVGQRLRCAVEGEHWSRVVSAELLAD